jgi:hypothetical protein
MMLPQHDAYDIRITEISVMPKGQPLFSELTTRIRINDEAAGEYVKVSQEGGHTSEQKWVLIDPKEWPAIRDAIEFMTQQCRGEARHED